MNTPSERKINYSKINNGDDLACQILDLHEQDEKAAYDFTKTLVDELSLTKKRNKLRLARQALSYLEASLAEDTEDYNYWDDDFIEDEVTEEFNYWDE